MDPLETSRNPKVDTQGSVIGKDRIMTLHPLRHRTFRDVLRLVSRDQMLASVRLGLAVASFIIYAAALLVVREHRYAQYGVEEFELAAAVSDLVYGAPIGTIYSGLLAPFVYKPLPIQQALEETPAAGARPAHC